MGVYWLGVGSAGSRPGGTGFLVLVATFAVAWLAAGLHALARPRGRAPAMVAVAALGLAVFAAVGPILLNAWIRGDYDRFIWVIRQKAPCDSMGGGPGTLWVFGTSWLAAAAATAYAVASGLDARRVAYGVAVGTSLCLVTALAMFPAPEVFAFVLGCL
ncbi:MAG TPA: hypothetical protein VGR87_14290 [Candidatus Limnocylindria bacterium]|jgi:hypothetical protein|nr:hypothetical protein [Candidatus Limnocylindria bacterium]